ncbi:MAG TPA: xanthine dehydrogenase family protein molybdopterin-binding subunit [Streptosporangiaceae bacterium]|jgi:xanthine dehydrogenase YagR molybdenum-binding subunit
MTARTRADGPAKVTGAARYAADWRHGDGVRYVALVTATIPAGRVTELDTSAAEAAPGVVTVLTHRNAPPLSEVTEGPYVHGLLPLHDDLVRYEGEPLAVVVADTLERAQEAAALVRVAYDRTDAVVDVDDALDKAYSPAAAARVDSSVGDVPAGLAAADVVVERAYSTASRHHSPMEPAATVATWADGELTLYDASQGVFNVRAVVASALGLPKERVRVIAAYTGGGFGAKGFIWPHEIIAAMTAYTVGGTVKLVLTRAQSFTSHGYQPATRQTVALGARTDGTLTAVRHTSVNATSTYAEHLELAGDGTNSMYAAPAIATSHRVAPVATILPTPMRAPAEGVGMFALESAMDELAYELGVDPLELRLRNYAERDPSTGREFSSKKLRECYVEGARRFGWAGRPMAPGSLREGRDLVGWGMASTTMFTARMPASARVTIRADGSVLIEVGTQEIGTGVYTVMPQVAAEVLGCSPDQVTIALGDTLLPEAGMTAGSSTTASVGSAVRAAARALAGKLASMAFAEGGAPPETVVIDGADVVLSEGPVGRISLRDLLGQTGAEQVSADGAYSPDDDGYTIKTFGAVFAEVRVDADLRLPRVSRITGVYSAGRIINELTARSQMTGGMIWGIGQALLEQSVPEPALGRFVSKNLAGYLVPVNADVHTLDASFVEEYDPHSGALGGKGIGELGASGVGAAIANAVHHATGIRVRDLPVTPEDLLV